ncbi:hypothetical protein T439DRAFT_369369, partial [Meredithblackwellia eburnea MCA 4105]
RALPPPKEPFKLLFGIRLTPNGKAPYTNVLCIRVPNWQGFRQSTHWTGSGMIGTLRAGKLELEIEFTNVCDVVLLTGRAGRSSLHAEARPARSSQVVGEKSLVVKPIFETKPDHFVTFDGEENFVTIARGPMWRDKHDPALVHMVTASHCLLVNQCIAHGGYGKPLPDSVREHRIACDPRTNKKAVSVFYPNIPHWFTSDKSRQKLSEEVCCNIPPTLPSELFELKVSQDKSRFLEARVQTEDWAILTFEKRDVEPPADLSQLRELGKRWLKTSDETGVNLWTKEIFKQLRDLEGVIPACVSFNEAQENVGNGALVFYHPKHNTWNIMMLWQVENLGETKKGFHVCHGVYPTGWQPSQSMKGYGPGSSGGIVFMLRKLNKKPWAQVFGTTIQGRSLGLEVGRDKFGFLLQSEIYEHAKQEGFERLGYQMDFTDSGLNAVWNPKTSELPLICPPPF